MSLASTHRSLSTVRHFSMVPRAGRELIRDEERFTVQFLAATEEGGSVGAVKGEKQCKGGKEYAS